MRLVGGVVGGGGEGDEEGVGVGVGVVAGVGDGAESALEFSKRGRVSIKIIYMYRRCERTRGA